MKIFNRIIILAIIAFTASCDIINPDEEIPAYIEILPFTYDSGGRSNSQKITDGWIYVNGEFIGAFDLPKTIPVLTSGEAEIFIDAGIKENGINGTPNIYPFYKRYNETITLVPGEVTTIQPTTSYINSGAQFILEEYFDASSHKFTDEVIITTTDIKEGNGSGLILLSDTDLPSISVYSVPLSTYPIESDISYLEMDYKTEVPLLVGVRGFDNSGNESFAELRYGLNIKTTWNKVYFNFTDIMRLLQQTNTAFYSIRILAQIPIVDGEFFLENAEVRLDNIKLVTF